MVVQRLKGVLDGGGVPMRSRRCWMCVRRNGRSRLAGSFFLGTSERCAGDKP